MSETLTYFYQTTRCDILEDRNIKISEDTVVFPQNLQYIKSDLKSVEITIATILQYHSILCTGLFISPSGISELDCATTKTDTAERSISIGRESLQVFFF